mmetsp:Transcript_123929/g.332784  ORF Transcript_123929/g.332784 Transcript_123929/m.332784 type:complete len:305 (-) Transcript_123929:414-1328(-)
MVPSAEDLRPANGKESGPRWHCVLMFTRQVASAHASRMRDSCCPPCAAELVKRATCWPKWASARCCRTSSMSEYLPMATSGPNCSSWKARISLVTGYITEGNTSVRSVSPPRSLITFAPLDLASSTSSARYPGLSGSGSGVMAFLPKGGPAGSAAIAPEKRLQNSSATDSWSMISLMAVQRWPLNAVLPARHSFTATSRSASGSTMPRFLPSSDSRLRKRCGCGCSRMSESAALEEPMNANRSTLPERMIGGMVSRPRPATKFTTPFGKHSAYTSMVSTWARPPRLGIFMTTEFPQRSAGMRVA